MKVIEGGRHGEPDYFALADVPQAEDVDAVAVSTGWWELDQLWRLYPEQFTIVTGCAGNGKSTFLLNVICNVARLHGMRSFLYVPENERRVRSILQRIWGAHEGFDEFARMQCFLKSSLPSAYDTVPKTLRWVLDKAVVAVERDDVDLLLIDPWNEIERAKPKDMLLTDYIGECLMYLKQFCKAMKVSVILVAHPTKAGVADGKPPGLADIEGSMNWANKCDNGLIVVRDQDKPTCKVISAKVREIGAGKVGICYFFVDAETGLFTPQKGAVS